MYSSSNAQTASERIQSSYSILVSKARIHETEPNMLTGVITIWRARGWFFLFENEEQLSNVMVQFRISMCPTGLTHAEEEITAKQAHIKEPHRATVTVHITNKLPAAAAGLLDKLICTELSKILPWIL